MIILSYWYSIESTGLRHDEIAELLNITPGTSRKRLQRAYRALADRVKKIASVPARHERIESWRESLLRRMVASEALSDE